MSIKQRLILSNIAMIIAPILFFIFLESVLGAVLFLLLDFEPEGEFLKTFHFLRFGILLFAVSITNGLLAYYVSKSVIKPVNRLSQAAERISEGDLDFQIESMKNDELGRLSKTFELMRRKLKESTEMQIKYEENRKELIANISHDLKTPITSIKGYVEGIQDGVANSPEKMNRYLKTIYSKAAEMDHLIDELFLFSKLDLNRVPFHFESIDLHAYFSDIIGELQYDLEKQGISISLNAEEGPYYQAVIDSEQLKRVAANIIFNSVKHMEKETKEIRIGLRAFADRVQVEIKDNGRGISKEALPHIFERFYRADLSRNTSTGGSGLGLAIAKRIIEEHSGDIWAESTPGKGTSIFFTLKKPQNKGVFQ